MRKPKRMPLSRITTGVGMRRAVYVKTPFCMLKPVIASVTPKCSRVASTVNKTITTVGNTSFLYCMAPTRRLTLPGIRSAGRKVVTSGVTTRTTSVTGKVPNTESVSSGVTSTHHILS